MEKIELIKKRSDDNRLRMLIIGAGVGGKIVAKEILNHPELGYEIIGFIDDDQAKLHNKFRHVEVIGSISDIPFIVKQRNIAIVIICIPSASGKIIRNIVSKCDEAGVRYRIVPGVYQIIGERVSVSPIRQVEMEDLLKRTPVTISGRTVEIIIEYLANKVVLVTGAGGSIGSELCRQICKIGPKLLVLLGRGENSIYEIYTELKEKFPETNLEPVICDVYDRNKLDFVMNIYRPEVVFHAAAYKHVPLMERFPEECVKNNIIGTLNIAEISQKYGVNKFVLISTDKAVNSVNNMGVSKRITELIIQCIAKQSHSTYVIVRFGNVLGSRGSVVPLFKRQLLQGGPLTVTDSQMTRFFMTIPEAAQLVIQSAAVGKTGDLFVLDMGEPVKILDMAETLIRLSGYEPYTDIDIKFIGIRPGEKLFEEVLTQQEGVKATKFKRIFQVEPIDIDEKKLMEDVEELRKLAEEMNRSEIIKKLWQIVWPYQ